MTGGIGADSVDVAVGVALCVTLSVVAVLTVIFDVADSVVSPATVLDPSDDTDCLAVVVAVVVLGLGDVFFVVTGSNSKKARNI